MSKFSYFLLVSYIGISTLLGKKVVKNNWFFYGGPVALLICNFVEYYFIYNQLYLTSFRSYILFLLVVTLFWTLFIRRKQPIKFWKRDKED